MTYINSPGQLGQILSARRKTLGLSQQRLAALLSISQNRLSELEAQPSRLTLERLMSLLNILNLDLEIRERPASAKSARDEW
jgi:HTH-type transcriptional regulator / antitoxin HipB